MEKGIWIGNGLDYYEDLPWLVEKGFTAVFINGDANLIRHKFIYALQCGIKTTVVDIVSNDWKNIIDEVDSKYYYYDEPYLSNISEELLIERLNYIRKKRPGSKFVIGDIRKIQEKRYKPIENLYYTYTSYTDNWYIPLFDKALPFGFGNQSPAIKRIYKRVGGRVPFIWAYGQNKLLCHPDEYHKLRKTCDDLHIDLMMLYLGDGPDGKYEFNTVSEPDLMENIFNFLDDKKPYTITLWLRRLNIRLKLSINYLIKTKNFKEFIDKLF